MKVLYFPGNGLGDVVLGCWIVESAKASGISIHLNPGTHLLLPSLLGAHPDQLTTRQGPLGPGGDSFYHHYEYKLMRQAYTTRFACWCQLLGVPQLNPVRPPYIEKPEDTAWATGEWHKIDPSHSKPRIILFPDTAWTVRKWPDAYYIDVANELKNRGYAVAAMAATEAKVSFMPCHWWYGFPINQVAAMIRQADVVISNDSGPAHLAGTIGTPTIAICGPTHGQVVFGHDDNIYPISSAVTPCVGCHFSEQRGYRYACDYGGCQALMQLDSKAVLALAVQLLRKAPKASLLAS